MGSNANILKGSEVIFIVRNGFVEVIEYNTEYLNAQEIHSAVEVIVYDEKPGDGIFRLTNTVFDWDESDTDEYGRKYSSEDHYLTAYDIEKIAEIEYHKTPSEKQHIALENGKKRIKRLNEWISSFDTEEYKYTVGKVWQYDPVCLRQTHGAGMSSHLHSFGDMKPTKANIENVMKFFVSFMKEKHGVEAKMDYAVIDGPERTFEFDDFFSEEEMGVQNGN